jgi:hypothetical protein
MILDVPSVHETVFDPFDGAEPRLLRRETKAPVRVNPEQAPAFMPGSRRVDLQDQ